MKKLLLLFVATASLLVSCDKSDDNNSVDNTTLLHGKWEAKSFDYSVTVAGEPINVEDDEDFELNGVVGTIFEFTSSNKVKISSYDDFDETWYTEEGTYVYNESAKTVTVTTINEFDGSSEVVVMKVNLLTNSNFNFTLNESFDFEDDDTGEEFEAVITINIKCEKK